MNNGDETRYKLTQFTYQNILIVWAVLIVSNTIYSWWVAKTGRYQTGPFYGWVFVGGFLIPVLNVVDRVGIMGILNYAAKFRGDARPFDLRTLVERQRKAQTSGELTPLVLAIITV